MPAESGEPEPGLLNRGFFIPVYSQISADKRPDQPGPDRALMIGPVTGSHIARVPADKPRVVRRETPQAHGREQLSLDDFQYFPGPISVEHCVAKTDGEDLVRPD